LNDSSVFSGMVTGVPLWAINSGDEPKIFFVSTGSQKNIYLITTAIAIIIKTRPTTIALELKLNVYNYRFL